MNKNKNFYSGEELRKRWQDGTLLPSEMNEEMLRVLLLHENEKIIKGEPYDKEIVEFCNNALFENQRLFTEEDFKESKKQLFEILHGKRKNVSPMSKVKIKKKFFKPLLKTIAVCILLIFCVQAPSIAAGGNFFDNISQWGKHMVSYIIGREEKHNDVDIIGAKVHVYKDIKGFRKQENLDVFIPENIHDNAILEINYNFEDNKKITVCYENSISLIIYLSDENPKKYYNSEIDILYSHNNIDYYIDLSYNSITWILDNNVYRMLFNFDIANYIEIINNLK